MASLSGAPVARSGFDVYLEGDTLIYLKEGCAESDARGRFFLSVFPEDPRDLPQTARDAGLEHEPLNFDFHRHGAIFDGKCVIIRKLPGYPIRRVETGQWLPGEGELWSARGGWRLAGQPPAPPPPFICAKALFCFHPAAPTRRRK